MRTPRRVLGGVPRHAALHLDQAIDVLQLGLRHLPVAVAPPPARARVEPDRERLGEVLVRMFLGVVVHAGAVQVPHVVAAPGVRVVHVAVGPPKVTEGRGPVAPPPQLVGVVEGVAGLVAQVHQHLGPRVSEQVIVDQPPQDAVGQVPGDVHADRAIAGPEVVVTQIKFREEGDAAGLELFPELLDALAQHAGRLEVQIADRGRQHLLQLDLADDRAIVPGASQTSAGPECRQCGHRPIRLP